MARKKNKPLQKLGIALVSSITLGFIVAAATSVLFLQSQLNTEHQNKLMGFVADSLQLRTNQYEARLSEQIKQMATSLQLIELMANGDTAARSVFETRLSEVMPNAVSVRLFNQGEAKIEREANPPFTFTSLDLVNRVEHGETVHPEAIKLNDRWLISLAAPIKQPNETISGSIFIYLDLKVLGAPLFEKLDGQLQLIQSFRNSPDSEFLNLGTGSASVHVERKLNNPNWTLRYTPSASLLRTGVGKTIIYLLPAIASFVIAFMGILVGLRLILASIRADTGHLQDQIGDITNDHFKSSDNYQHPEFLELDSTLEGLTQEYQRQIEEIHLKVQSTAIANNAASSGPVSIRMTDQDMINEGYDDRDQNIEEEETANDAQINVDVSSIFRAYDIRGVVGKNFTAPIVEKIGLAIGTEAGELGQQTLIVGADGRLSSPELVSSLIKGITASGRDVVDIGFVTTPMLYYATHNSDTRSGVMLTGSHNPADYNGIKIVLDGKTLIAEEIQKLYQRYLNDDFSSGDGQVSKEDIREDYIDAISDDVVVAKPLKVVVDCGNGIGGDFAPELLGNLGCEVISLYCDVDGNFPNHHPDPIDPANLEDLILTVKSQEADIGIALDGDADRLVVITKEGEIVWPDRLLMLFSKDVVSRNPGSDVVYDIKCSRHLNSVISRFGGRPIVSRSGHSYIKAKMAETDAMLGGEMSGHICFKERWFGFDDGLYAAARLLEIIGSQPDSLTELLAEFPASISTPEIKIPVADSQKSIIIERFANDSSGFEDATITTIDGLRVDFSDSWGLIRASNTNPSLTLRFEADNEESLTNIQALFRDKLASVHKKLTF